MNAHALAAAVVLGALHGHRHRGGFVGLIVLVVIVAVVTILLVQRRRDHRSIDESSVTAARDQSLPAPGVPEHLADEHLANNVRTSSVGRGTGEELTRVDFNHELPPGRYGVVGLVRSEWTKLRTVRSTMWTLGVTIVLGIGVSAIATAETRANWQTMSFGDRVSFDPTSTSLIGVFIGQFAIGVLGALVISAEYGTGTIRATFSAAPRRPLVLVAKTAVFGFVAVVVAEIVAFVAFFLGQALLSSPATHATLATPGALRAVAGSGLYVAVLGLFSLGLATIIRHTAGAISAYVGILLVLPLIIQALPNSIVIDVRRFLPDRIGVTIISRSVGPNVFSPWIGLLVLCGYAAAALVIGGLLLVRRDA